MSLSKQRKTQAHLMSPAALLVLGRVSGRCNTSLRWPRFPAQPPVQNDSLHVATVLSAVRCVCDLGEEATVGQEEGFSLKKKKKKIRVTPITRVTSLSVTENTPRRISSTQLSVASPVGGSQERGRCFDTHQGCSTRLPRTEPGLPVSSSFCI